MERKQKIELVIAVVIIVLLVISVLFLLLRNSADQPIDEFVPTQDEEVVEEEQEEDEFAILPHSVARSFVERFGSFSSESDYTNVEDVKSFATASLQSRLDDIAQSARQDLSQSYYGISTQVVIIEIIDQTEATATLAITTQREESIDSPANTSIRYQDILLNMIWDGQRWLVDDFTWQE